MYLDFVYFLTENYLDLGTDNIIHLSMIIVHFLSCNLICRCMLFADSNDFVKIVNLH